MESINEQNVTQKVENFHCMIMYLALKIDQNSEWIEKQARYTVYSQNSHAFGHVYGGDYSESKQ